MLEWQEEEGVAVRLSAGLVALVLLAVVLQDAFEVMLLPRRLPRRLRLTRVYFRVTWKSWTALSRLLPARSGEGFLSVFGALSMVLLFVLWIASLIVGFGMLEWALEWGAGPEAGISLNKQLYLSGATFFTVGYGDVVPHRGATRILAVLEAGTGLGFIAAVIGYLPVLYQFFSRREAHVIQLDARAGSPPAAAAMLARHAGPGGPEKLDEFLREWEIWGSELLESHLSYPMLAFYRSQHENQSWLAAIGCVMDTCALILVGGQQSRLLQARMTFTMIRQVLVEMARSFDVVPSRYEGGDRLDHQAYRRLQNVLQGAGLCLENGTQSGEALAEETLAEETLAALRATYEPLLDGLSRYLLLPLPYWISDESSLDNWEGGHRGLIAARLVQQLSASAAAPERGGAAEGSGRRWRRLRQQLRNGRDQNDGEDRV